MQLGVNNGEIHFFFKEKEWVDQFCLKCNKILRSKIKKSHNLLPEAGYCRKWRKRLIARVQKGGSVVVLSDVIKISLKVGYVWRTVQLADLFCLRLFFLACAPSLHVVVCIIPLLKWCERVDRTWPRLSRERSSSYDLIALRQCNAVLRLDLHFLLLLLLLLPALTLLEKKKYNNKVEASR